MSGRLATLSAQSPPNLPGKTHAFESTYEPGSSLLDKVTPDPVGAGGPVHELDNDYKAHRNVLLQKKNTRTIGTPGDLSVIGYTVNELGQRVQRNLSGEIRAEFYGGQAADPSSINWGYDALGQVTNEDKPSTTADSVTFSYGANELNQYTSRLPLPQRTEPLGEIPEGSKGQGEGSSVQPAYDQDGNMTTGLLNGSGTGQFEYDGANQLIRTQSTATSDPTRYAYDAFGRRIAKVTYPNAGGAPTAATVFLYDGWNLIAEYKLISGAWALDHTYTWGLDLSGSTQGAGGVGGLISVTKHEAQSTTHFYPIYDGNGNVEAYIDSNGSPAAIYQYDAFGNVLSGGGNGDVVEQAKFPHRFSTKYQDDETGLLYYGYRYNHTLLGRWLNRDPLEEGGGVNMFGFVQNSTSGLVDPNGLISYNFDEENCDFFVTMTMKVRFVRKHNFLGFPASPEWDEGRKQLWKSAAYLVVLQYFEGLPLRCKPTNAACCVCKNGVKVRFSIQFIEDGKADVKAKVSSFTGDRSSAELAGDNANLDWDDPWGANNAATPGGDSTIYQNTLIHEIGHLLGWDHPGQKLPTGQRAKPGSDADYYAKPQSLMGVGMEMQLDDFNSAFCGKIESKRKNCSKWEAK